MFTIACGDRVLAFVAATPFVAARDNSVQPFIPELWAQESLAILRENMVAAQLVHTDFSDVVANYGETVHTRRPGEFVSKRKTPSDDVDVQDATATDVPVVLNQHLHVSFMIRDSEQTKSFKDLVEIYLSPAMLAQARQVDRTILGQYPQFLQYSYGGLGKVGNANAIDFILGTRNVLNRNKAYEDGRNLLLTPSTEATFLSLAQFTQAYAVGDQGQSLIKGALGTKYGFGMYMCQNTAEVTSGVSDVTTGFLVNNGSGYAVGATSIAVDGGTGALVTGNWLVIAGDDSPQQITAHSETLGNTTSITISPGLRKAVVDEAAITVYASGAVNLGGGYPSGWAKEIAYDVFTLDPVVGQFVTFGTDTVKYTVTQVDVSAKTITLDRPLVSSIADDAHINLGPAGSYNLAFHRNAIAIVTRPLAQPRAGSGAVSAVVNDDSMSMRATISYQGLKQGHLVTLDMLFGVAILDAHLGAVLLG
jgi:hypothetical protein